MLPLLLAFQIDGAAALRHAAALSALGPHPWGSPRAGAAAEYVAAQFRRAGLSEVRLQAFESHGIKGTNVVGVLRAPGPEFVVVGAHHDTAPEAPGAYDDGGGVGVVIEVARALARSPTRPRTIVFVSWDGEEAWSTGRTTTAGSRAFIKGLGPEARHLVAAFAVEMCGWKGGTPVFHPIAYADPLRPGAYAVTPSWLMEAALSGARKRGAALAVGDPLISWLYQPAVRTFQARLYGDDLSFLQAGLPAVFASDSSFTAYYPWYHQASDTADKLDAAALARMGQGVLGVVDALGQVPRGPAAEPHWFAISGQVIGRTALSILAVGALIPGVVRGFSAGGLPLGARLVQAVLVCLLLWRHPVPAVWIFVFPSALSAVSRKTWANLLGLLPTLALVGLGAAAWLRGFVRGTWLTSWDWALILTALALYWVRPGGPMKAPRIRKAGLRRKS